MTTLMMNHTQALAGMRKVFLFLSIYYFIDVYYLHFFSLLGILKSTNEGITFFHHYKYLILCNVSEHDDEPWLGTTKTGKDEEGGPDTCLILFIVLLMYINFFIDDDLHLDMAKTGKNEDVSNGFEFYSLIT